MSLRRRIVRNYRKNKYKELKRKDSLLGLKIDKIIQDIHNNQYSSDTFKNKIEEILALKEDKKFMDDFPSFSKFNQFVVSEDVNLDDILQG